MSQFIKDGALATCVEELNLPGSPWHDVSQLVSRRLADRIKLEGLTHSQLVAITKFVGEDFIKKYSLYQSVQPEENREAKSSRLSNDSEVQEFLKSLTLKAAKDAECVGTSQNKRNCYNDFLALTKQIFSANFDIENQSLKPKNKRLTDLPFQLYTDDETNNLGELVVNILRNDPSRLRKVMNSMQHRFLPPQLRQYLYRILLLKKRKESVLNNQIPHQKTSVKTNEDYNQKKMREDFAAGVKAGLRDLHCKNPTKSPIYHLIQSSVIEVFENSIGLALFSDNIALQNEICRALNILYTLKQKFSYHFVLWLLPLQVTLMQSNEMSKEHDYKLAMYLDIVLTNCQVDYSETTQIARNAWKELTRKEKPNCVMDVKLRNHFWAMELLLDDHGIMSALKNANKTSVKSNFRSADSTDMVRDLDFFHPVVSIRNWISHFFVGFLDLNISLYIWDQMFLWNWSHKCICRACVVLVNCLAQDVLECKEKSDLHSLLLDGFEDLTLPQFVKVWKDINAMDPL